MNEYIFIKALHVTSIAFSVGTLFFLTFILAWAKKKSDPSSYKNFAPKLVSYARQAMVINVGVIVFSGFYLLFRFYNFDGIIIVKTLFGVAVVILFYAAPWILRYFSKVSGFHPFFHFVMLAMMIATITIAQIS